jgi:hypothetical protein
MERKKTGVSFEGEFARRFRGSGLKISPVGNNKDYVISNDEASTALLVRTVFPFNDKVQKYVRYPAPFYNAEAVVLFRYKTDDSVYPPDVFTFIYKNQVLMKTDFLIFKTSELKECFKEIPLKPSRSGYYKMLLWIFPGDFVFMASNLSGEGEWYLLGGLNNGNDPSCSMGKDSKLDFSKYLNRWNIF